MSPTLTGAETVAAAPRRGPSVAPASPPVSAARPPMTALRVGAPGGLSSEAIGRPLSGCRGRYRTPWKDFHGIVPSPLHGLAIAIHHSGLFDLRAGFAGFRRHVDGPGAADDPGFARQAARHARLRLPELALGRLAVVVEEIRLVREPDRRETPLVQLEALVLDHVVEVEDVGRHRVELVVGQRLRIAEGHGAADVVHHRRGVGPIRADRPDRVVARQRAVAAGQDRPAPVRLAELAVARRAALEIEPLAGFRRALAGRQPAPVGADGDVPAGDLLARRLAADAELLRLSEGSCRRNKHRHPGRSEAESRDPPAPAALGPWVPDSRFAASGMTGEG